jgi:drug/metabolite transporter (DMT)-like permease
MPKASLPAGTASLKGIVTVVAGVILISFDALLVRLAAVDGWNVSFWRGLLMALAFLILSHLVPSCQIRSSDNRKLGVWLAALMMAGSSLCLVLAFTLTQVANAVVILSAAPLFAALISHIFIGERCSLRTWLAIIVCIAGVFWVMSGSLGAGTLLGDGLAAASALFIGAYFTVFRRYPEISRPGVIMRGGILLCLAALPFATPLSLPHSSYAWLVLAGLVQMPVALLLITSATRFLPAAEVSLFLLLETCLAPIWVWLVLGESPPATTFSGGVLIVATLVLHTLLGLYSRAQKAESV